MNKSTKVIGAVGIGAILYYLFTKKKVQAQAQARASVQARSTQISDSAAKAGSLTGTVLDKSVLTTTKTAMGSLG